MPTVLEGWSLKPLEGQGNPCVYTLEVCSPSNQMVLSGTYAPAHPPYLPEILGSFVLPLSSRFISYVHPLAHSLVLPTLMLKRLWSLPLLKSCHPTHLGHSLAPPHRLQINTMNSLVFLVPCLISG